MSKIQLFLEQVSILMSKSGSRGKQRSTCFHRVFKIMSDFPRVCNTKSGSCILLNLLLDAYERGEYDISEPTTVQMWVVLHRLTELPLRYSRGFAAYGFVQWVGSPNRLSNRQSLGQTGIHQGLVHHSNSFSLNSPGSLVEMIGILLK